MNQVTVSKEEDVAEPSYQQDSKSHWLQLYYRIDSKLFLTVKHQNERATSCNYS